MAINEESIPFCVQDSFIYLIFFMYLMCFSLDVATNIVV